MKHKLPKAAILLLVLLLVGGCQTNLGDDDALRGRITLWHSWPSTDAVVLEETLAQFQEIHPDVHIITVAMPPDQILEEFINTGTDGLGPDLLIGADDWIKDLANMGLIRAVSTDDITPILLSSRNLALMQYQGQHYGIPRSLAPRSLYYNKHLVEKPPTTLDELLHEAAAGNSVAFVPRFEEAYWGIQAFGQGLFDAEGQFTVDESGFEEWLNWLDEAQSAPGIILNIDDDSLLDLFKSQQIAYYVAGPEKQARISAMIGEENPFEFGVVPLPGGPHGPAGPLLSAETIFLYAFTSPEQSRTADALAAFLVNQQQSIRFMRELNQVPANPAVKVDRRIYPIVNGFEQQAQTAVVIPNEVPSEAFESAGNLAYVSVLSGSLTPAEAACQFGQDVSVVLGYSESDTSLTNGCEAQEDDQSQKKPSEMLATDTGGDNGHN